MKFRKPELIPLLFIVAATGLLVSLGAWQLERLVWKEGMLAAINEAQAQKPLATLPRNLGSATYRKVKLSGRFLQDKTLLKPAALPGIGAGFFLLTPFKMANGRTIMVNRGFAPQGKAMTPTGVKTIEGVLRPLRTKRFFSPENQPEKNLWFHEDIGAMSEKVDVALLPMIVEATGPRKKEVYPMPSDGKISLRNDHFAYAITWFSLALVGLVMFAFYHRETEAKA